MFIADMEMFIAVVGAVISILAAGFAFYQARLSAEALKQTRLARLFSTFDTASNVTLQHPELLYSVHGLDEALGHDEAICVAYLSLLLDGFQHYYGEETKGRFAAMSRDLKSKSNFLNRVLALPENRKRWEYIKALYYGDQDKDFITAIDDIIIHEANRKL